MTINGKLKACSVETMELRPSNRRERTVPSAGQGNINASDLNHAMQEDHLSPPLCEIS